MLKRYRSAALGLGALLVAGGIALAAGNYFGYPIVGQNSFCSSTVSGAGGFNAQGNVGGAGVTGQGQASSGSLCAQTVPAGPPEVTGEELINADTQIGSGTNPQTVNIPSVLLGGINDKVNRIIGGDFFTNLWQRGTTPLSASTSYTSAVMTADRWWIQGSASGTTQVTVSQQIPASSATDYIGNLGLYAWQRIQRPSAQTGTGLICVGQTLDQKQASVLIGKNAILSFYANTGANFSPANSNITVQIGYYTAADATSAAQSTLGFGGTNTLTSALSIGGQGSGIAGFQNVAAGTSPGFPVGSVASNVVTLPLAAAGAPTRYSVYGAVPSANAAGTAVTGVVVGFCWTPVGTAGTNDWVEFEGVQIQAMPATATANMPSGVISPTGFERRYAEIEAGLQLNYSYIVNESITAVNFRGMCAVSSTSLANCQVHFPVPMRLAPAMKYTAGFGECTTTACTAQAACTALTTSATVTGLAATPNDVLVDCASTTAFAAAGSAGFLMDKGSAGGAGVISASAEP